MNNGIIPLIGFAFIVFTLSGGLVLTLVRKRKSQAEARLEKFLPYMQAVVEEPEEVVESKEKGPRMIRRLIAVIGTQFAGKAFVRRWSTRLEQAALPLKPEEFFALRLITAVVALAAFFLLGFSGAALIPAVLLGYLLPRLYLNRRKDKRLGRCAAQLAPALGTMATAMRAGFSFIQSMQLVGREVPDPLGSEFERTIREINYGVPIEEAFQRLLERLPDADLDLVVTALLVQRSTGGNLAEILESMQETIQERVRIKEELHALTAQGRLSAWIISLLPVALGFFLNFMNPEYFSSMLTHPLGWLLLGSGTVSGFIGWMTIRKIVRIEV
ncbi:type II secretion system F family protein [Effusibacillus consociatus]|uniref:Type II secretion system F family protein n=1 Tax=Effusibacillus consociatus TaxID=1117041 RepID=A0ABV9Q0A7_9BACL